MRAAAGRAAALVAVGAGALLGVPHAVLPAAAVTASPSFSASPATYDPTDPLTRSYFRPEAVPGAVLGEGVIVTDTGDSPVQLYVYAVDGLTGTTSGTVYANRSNPRQKAGLWLTPGVSSLVLQPHQRQLVLFQVRVPADATPGDHVAGIAFENARPTTGGEMAVTEVIREVIGVQVRVPGPGQFHLTLSRASFAVPPAAAAASVVVRLGDDGDRLGQPKITVALHGPAGFTDTLTRQLDTLLPGDMIDYPIVWPRALPAGAYTIDVAQVGVPGVALTTTADLSAAQPGLSTPSGTVPVAPLHPAPARHAHPSGSGWAVLALVGAGGAATVGIGLALRTLTPKRRARRRHPSGGRGLGGQKPVAGSP